MTAVNTPGYASHSAAQQSGLVPELTFSKALIEAYHWTIHRTPDDTIYCHPMYSGENGKINLAYDMTAVDAHEPRLLRWLRDALRYRASMSLSDSDLRLALDHWKSDCAILPQEALTYPDSRGNREMHVSWVREVDVVGDVLRLNNALWFNTSRTACGLTYATSQHFSCLRIATSWLDDHHANWRDKYAFGMSLGLTPDAIKSLVFGVGDYVSTLTTAQDMSTRAGLSDLDLV